VDKLSAASPPANTGSDTASPSPAAQASEYAGGDACFACHDIEAAFKKNPHYKTWTDQSLAWSERGCETCHGPAQAHIDGGGDIGQILSFKTASPQKISDTCLDCHLQQVERANFMGSEHGLNSVACTECHSVHTPQESVGLLKARTPALCYDCHGEVRPEFNKPFHHKVHEGLMKCTDCHNQHGSFARKQLRESTGTDQVCFTCHADKQGPFVFEHAPVKLEGCTLCHQPHGSVNARLLKRHQVNTLCLECHTETPGIPEAVGVPTFHSQTNPRYVNCTVCHVNIHGSNLNVFFFE
jgi:DmsE family decaheme c-type cytochrome